MPNFEATILLYFKFPSPKPKSVVETKVTPRSYPRPKTNITYCISSDVGILYTKARSFSYFYTHLYKNRQPMYSWAHKIHEIKGDIMVGSKTGMGGIQLCIKLPKQFALWYVIMTSLFLNLTNAGGIIKWIFTVAPRDHWFVTDPVVMVRKINRG